MKERKLTFAQVSNKCNDIAGSHKKKNIDLILGVATGGIIPGMLVAKKLKLLDKYQTIRPNKPIPEELLNIKRSGGNVLIVDDIEDSGDTRFVLMSKFELIDEGQVYWETVMKKTNPDEWVIFPWETNQDEIGTRQTEL